MPILGVIKRERFPGWTTYSAKCNACGDIGPMNSDELFADNSKVEVWCPKCRREKRAESQEYARSAPWNEGSGHAVRSS